MKVMTQWMRVLVVGVALTGCIEPMAPAPGQDGMSLNEQVYAYGDTSLTTTPPPARPYSRTMDTTALWSSASARRFVHVVTYTLPPDVTGAIPPPRFRAFGMDMATRSFLFTVDGERVYMSAFNDRMLAEKAVVIITPIGFKYPGACTATRPPTTGGTVRAARMPDEGSDAGTNTVCGTQPVQQIPPVGGQEGGDEWLFYWSDFMGMAGGLSATTIESQFPGGTLTTGGGLIAE
jgi:hypothetical protein